jgi:mercuric reductase
MKQIREVELRVSGMTCDACATHVRKALESVKGVVSVKVPGWRQGEATVQSERGVAAESLIQAVQGAGYSAKLKEQRESNSEKARTDFDLMVIGAGSAGFAAAIRASELGFRAALVERSTIGGTCVNVGCVPSKTLIRAVEAYHRAGETPFSGVHVHRDRIDWPAVIRQKDELVRELRKAKYTGVLAAYPDIRLIEGKARLLGGTRVEINGTTYQPRKIVIATGASPWAAPIPGLSEVEFLDSAKALDLQRKPDSMLVIGANAVGLEIAQAYSRAGTEVTVLEALPRIAPFEDETISRTLAELLSEEGMRIFASAAISHVAKRNGAYELSATIGGRSQRFQAEQLLVATGRRPNTAGFGLDTAGVELGARGAIVVDEHLRTTNPEIYAAGDVIGREMFVYVAAYAGTMAADNALNGAKRAFDTSAMARVTFTDPQVASTGLTEEQARAAGHEVKVSVLPMSAVPRALAARDTRGLIKLVADQETDRLLGAHILAPEGAEIIQPAVMAMKFGIPTRELGGMLFPYLTNAEALKLAIQTFEKDVSKLSCCAG